MPVEIWLSAIVCDGERMGHEMKKPLLAREWLVVESG